MCRTGHLQGRYFSFYKPGRMSEQIAAVLKLSSRFFFFSFTISHCQELTRDLSISSSCHRWRVYNIEPLSCIRDNTFRDDTKHFKQLRQGSPTISRPTNLLVYSFPTFKLPEYEYISFLLPFCFCFNYSWECSRMQGGVWLHRNSEHDMHAGSATGWKISMPLLWLLSTDEWNVQQQG